MPLVTLPLDPIVNIFVNLSARAAVRKAFDLALLVGETDIIPAEERLRVYTGLSEMLQDGFDTNDRLYKAATLLFEQNKKPQRVVIGAIGENESPLEAIRACREANQEWYVGIYCAEATTAEHVAIAEYIEAIKPSSLYAYTTDDTKVLDDIDDNIFKEMKSRNYRRIIGQYSTKHPDAVAAVIGYAMGSQTDTAGSAYTLAFKQEVGVQTENVDSSFKSSAVDKIKANYGNIYINRGTYYDVFEEGTMADGTWFDEMINLDKLANDIQLNVMDLLYQNPKVPHTEAGMTRIHNAIKEPCERARIVGFIAPGVWKAGDILNLKHGDTLPNGYFIQSESIDAQAQADRDARKSPPVYVALKLAGAIHHVTIQVDVNR